MEHCGKIAANIQKNILETPLFCNNIGKGGALASL
jgi:hypothetical protein